MGGAKQQQNASSWVTTTPAGVLKDIPEQECHYNCYISNTKSTSWISKCMDFIVGGYGTESLAASKFLQFPSVSFIYRSRGKYQDLHCWPVLQDNYRWYCWAVGYPVDKIRHSAKVSCVVKYPLEIAVIYVGRGETRTLSRGQGGERGGGAVDVSPYGRGGEGRAFRLPSASFSFCHSGRGLRFGGGGESCNPLNTVPGSVPNSHSTAPNRFRLKQF